jgi:flagellar biosynthesis/type III secretory pathway protein FliH
MTACRTGAQYPNPVEARGVENQAYNSGYRDGQSQGRDDGRHNRLANPTAASRYRSGDHDYYSHFGTRDEYRRVYRTAFEQGYDVGYREGR